jgi:hypothetical protein
LSSVYLGSTPDALAAGTRGDDRRREERWPSG